MSCGKIAVFYIAVAMQLLHFSILFIIGMFLMGVGLASDYALKLNGDFVQGGLVFGQLESKAKITINDRKVRVSKDGEFIIGFGRDYPKQAVLTIDYINGQSIEHELKISQREYKVQRIDGLPNAQVNPDKQTLVRIKQELARIRKARELDDDRLDFKQGFIWPTKGPITGVYGSQRILNGEPRQPHYGIDVAAPIGTPVIAPASGIVTYTENMYFSGWTMVLDHGYNLSSSFLHLDKILVQVGDRIDQGEIIALVGASGRVTGPHLDWRMNWHAQRIDPGLLMQNQKNSKN